MLKKYTLTYLVCALIVLALDALWLGVIMKDFFQTELSHLLKPEVDYVVATLFYLVFAAVIVLFGVKTGLDKNSAKVAVLYGAIFGFMCYGTYDFTNLATLPDWPISVVIVDIAWGSFLAGFSSILTFFAVRKFVS